MNSDNYDYSDEEDDYIIPEGKSSLVAASSRSLATTTKNNLCPTTKGLAEYKNKNVMPNYK